MGWRFQRRVKVIPGVTLNLSKSGVSTSLGVRGAHINFGKGRRRTTVGIPGTGISYTDVESTHQARQEVTLERCGPWRRRARIARRRCRAAALRAAGCCLRRRITT